MDNDMKKIAKAFMLVMQIGFSVLTPIFLLVAIGVFIDSRYGKSFTLPLLLIGVLAGARNGYVLVKHAIKSMEDEKDV
ncbi:MAG: AtpZ/AtpI family protein [Lachnospiraceae bacterium]|nr:AtpZ/AtpI family protein [Lachnospiraceae bacterium]